MPSDDANTGVPAGPLTDEQLELLTKLGDPLGAFGEERTYLPRAVAELQQLRELIRHIYGRANVGSVPLGRKDLEDILQEITVQIRTTPGFFPGKAGT